MEAINQYHLFLDSDIGTTDDRIEACLHVGSAIVDYTMINKHSKLFCNPSYMIDQSQKHVAVWANFLWSNQNIKRLFTGILKPCNKLLSIQ